MSKNKTWAPPGWPWELDLLSLIFLVAGLLIPYNIFIQHYAESSLAANQAALKLKEQTYILWSIGLVVLFVMHLALAGASDDSMSTPFIHLFSPLVFAGLAYYRIYTVSHDMGQASFVTGHWTQMLLFGVVVVAATLIMARLGLARHMHRYRDESWDLICPARYDRSFFTLIVQFRPLVYPPRRYRLSQNGILVEGWFYAIVLPFSKLQSMNPVRFMGISTAGHYYASNSSNLVRFELLDSDRPLFISPEQRDEFIQYCMHHLLRARPSSVHRSRHGTNPGVTARDTHPGLTARDTHASGRPHRPT